jgi:hypothetical protein
MKIKLSKSQWEEAGRKAGWIKSAQFGGGYENLDIGPTPNGEDCAQVGNKIYDYCTLSKMENVAYAHQIARMFPDMPQGLQIVRKGNSHDFGTYYEINLKWRDGDDEAAEYAYKIEGSCPENWDNEARAELESKGYFVELEKGKVPKSKNNLKDEEIYRGEIKGE